jgi:hypothetical protein
MKNYIKPGDVIEGDSVELKLTTDVNSNGDPKFDLSFGDATELRIWIEDKDYPEDGHWCEIEWDYRGTKETNPNYGRLYWKK